MKMIKMIRIRRQCYHGLCNISLEYIHETRKLPIAAKRFALVTNITPAVRQNLYNDIAGAVLQNTQELNKIISPMSLSEQELAAVANPTHDSHVVINTRQFPPATLQKLGKSMLEWMINSEIVSDGFEWEKLEGSSRSSMLRNEDIVAKTIMRLGIRANNDKTLFKSFTMMLAILRFKYGHEAVTGLVSRVYIPNSYTVISQELI